MQLELARVERALLLSQEVSLAAKAQVENLTFANTRLLVAAVELEREITELRHHAYHDALTGLPNRALLIDRLGQAIARADRAHSMLALLMLDIDHFKAVNDRFGHGAGDALLRQMAEHLLHCIRATDTACRYGGDEFIVVLPDVGDERYALNVANKIGACLAGPCIVDGLPITVTASIGIAVYPAAGTNSADLIRRADEAMYRAKASGDPLLPVTRIALA